MTDKRNARPLRHTDKTYEHELSTLRNKLLKMSSEVQRQITLSMRALTERNSQLAESVKSSDPEVNRLEIEVDELCRRLLALRQPAASDFRFIATALKIVTDLERIGDSTVNIAERVLDLNETAPLAKYQDLPRLAERAQAQVQLALEAFIEADPEKADQVLKGDDNVDDLFLRIFNELLTYMMESSSYIRRATSLLFVAKHLERIGDHAMNIAEMVIYMVRGTDIRHPKSRAMAAQKPRDDE